MSAGAGALLLPWDTEFWGVRIARVEGGRDDGGPRGGARRLGGGERGRLPRTSSPARTRPTAHAAEDAGFRLMDVRVGLARAAAPVAADPRVRPYEPDDLPALRAIARSSHGATRFYADPRFPDERCDDLYDAWITRAVEGWADAVFVAEREGRPAGYSRCHVDAERATIGLVAVAPEARGAGLGAALVERGGRLVRRRTGLGEIGVVTQGRSAPALRVYERAGFTVESLGFWFHKWYAR